MSQDLTRGAVWRVIPAFALPLLVGNLTLQVYKLTVSFIVGRFLGKDCHLYPSDDAEDRRHDAHCLQSSLHDNRNKKLSLLPI